MDPYNIHRFAKRTRLEDMVSASIEIGRGRDPVTKQQLPMFGLNSRMPLKLASDTPVSISPHTSQRALSVTSDSPKGPHSHLLPGFRTSQFPKAPLTPELKSKLRVLSLYHAFLRSGKLRENGLVFAPKKKQRSARRTGTHLKSNSISGNEPISRPLVSCQGGLTLPTVSPCTFPSPSPIEESPRGRTQCKPISLLPVTGTSLSPKGRAALVSRDSQSSAQTPLAPVYTRMTFGAAAIGQSKDRKMQSIRGRFHYKTHSIDV